jgi:hypothetical protein
MDTDETQMGNCHASFLVLSVFHLCKSVAK